MNKRFIYRITIWVVLSSPNLNLFAQNSSENRDKSLILLNQIISGKDHRHDISRRVSLKDSTWQEWQKRTGELPPDFSKMPSRLILTSPLSDYKGTMIPVRNMTQWNNQREWIKQEFQQWISGTVPPAPKDFKVTILKEFVENGVQDQMIELHFGPQYKAKITFELMIPEGKGPFPVYMTQWTHRHWAQIAVRRGYAGCVYAAADGNDDSQAYQALYPEYDFSGLMRRAWAASRVIDYLISKPQINKYQIAIAGHSRNGKQSLWAAAFDDRIQAVISSSSGTGGDTPWVYTEPQFCNQTIDDIYSNASHWFHPRLRFFFGNEDKLPVDQNSLLALIAPRALLMNYSLLESSMNPWANEQCFCSVRSVYDFMNASGKIGILSRLGEHPVAERDIDRCIDFLDIQFGRKKEKWNNQLFFDFQLDAWMKKNQSSFNKSSVKPICLEQYSDQSDFEKIKPQIQKEIYWLLGNKPPKVKAHPAVPATASKVDWMDRIIGRPTVKNCSVVYFGSYEAIGDYQNAMLYLPTNADANKKFPVILFLHQYAFSNGFAYGYTDYKESGNNSLIFQKLIDQGFAVLSIDLLGFGTRIEEGTRFYDRYPAWSKMGKMVEDVGDCVDALSDMNHIDPTRIYIIGNSIGGTVGLISAALDSRIKGVAALSGVAPFRSEEVGLNNIRWFSEVHGFIPRIGAFKNDLNSVPVDFSEILACISPRQLMIISPRYDHRYISPGQVETISKQVGRVYSFYQKTENFVSSPPKEINRMTNSMLTDIITFFKKE